MRYTSKDIAQLGTILGLWAHPDDEVFASGALMAIARAHGQRVVVVTATRGDAGKTADEKRWPQQELARIRTDECEKALDILGVSEHHWLDYVDGELVGIDEAVAIERIMNLLDGLQPDTIVSFEPEGITGHDDHKTAHRWAVKLSREMPHRPRVLCATECQEYYERYGKKLHEDHNVYFNVDKPKVVSTQSADMCVRPDKAVQEQKYQAIEAHASQTAAMLKSDEGREAIRCLCECECFIFSE